MKIELIKKLRLKKGCRYIIFFPKSAGINALDLAKLNKEYIELLFILEDTKGIKVIEK